MDMKQTLEGGLSDAGCASVSSSAWLLPAPLGRFPRPRRLPPIAVREAPRSRSPASIARSASLPPKVEALTKDALKWNDRIALINEDMRIYPRCLENPGPNTANITDVFANSCAKIPAQTWMISSPITDGGQDGPALTLNQSNRDQMARWRKRAILCRGGHLRSPLW